MVEKKKLSIAQFFLNAELFFHLLLVYIRKKNPYRKYLENNKDNNDIILMMN